MAKYNNTYEHFFTVQCGPVSKQVQGIGWQSLRWIAIDEVPVHEPSEKSDAFLERDINLKAALTLISQQHCLPNRWLWRPFLLSTFLGHNQAQYFHLEHRCRRTCLLEKGDSNYFLTTVSIPGLQRAEIAGSCKIHYLDKRTAGERAAVWTTNGKQILYKNNIVM